MLQRNQWEKAGIVSWLLNQNRTSIPRFLYLLLLFFLPTQLGKHFFLPESYVLGIRVDYLSFILYFSDILLFLLLFLCAISYRHQLLSWVRVRPLVAHPYVKIASLFFITILISLFTAERPLLVAYGCYKILEMVLFVFLTVFFLKERSFRRNAVVVFSLSMMLQVVIALSQFVLQHSVGGILYYLGERTFSISTPGISKASIQDVLVLRPYGTLPHPNVLSGYLLTGIILLFGELVPAHSQRLVIWFRFVLFFSALGVILTLSRMGVILLVLSMSCFLFLSYSNRIVKTPILPLLFMLSVFVVFFIAYGGLFEGLHSGSETISERVSLMKSAFAMIVNHPLIGVGLNHFLVELPHFTSLTSPVFLIQPVHNIFLFIFSELGVFGLLPFLLLWIVLIRRSIHLKMPVKTVAFLLLFIFFSIGMIDHYFLTLQQGQLLFACVIGYIFALGKKNTR